MNNKKTTHERGFTGFWLPVEIIDAHELSWLQRLIWAEIQALQKGKLGACIATNEHFEEVFHVSAKTIANALTQLRQMDWVEWKTSNQTRVMKAKFPEIGNKKSRNRENKIPKSGIKNPEIGNAVYREKTIEKTKEITIPPKAPQGGGDFSENLNGGLSENSAAEQIYDLYPRKVGKPAALRAIAIALRSTPPELLQDAVRRYAEVVAGWPDHQRIYIPHAATWINQRRWEDAETFATRSAPPQGGRPASYNATPSGSIDPTIF